MASRLVTISEAEVRIIREILREAARSEILPRFWSPERVSVREKTSHLDLVTEADVAAERRISTNLARAFPSAMVIGEEATAANPSILRHLAEAERAILVDPIDGTKNFASGLPLFGVIAAVVERGEVVAGVILDPIGDHWTVALRGKGAWTERADGTRRSHRVAASRPLGEMVGLVSWIFLAEPLRSRVLHGMAHTAGAADYRCTAHHYRLLADGHYDFALFGKLMPWDHAAGWLIYNEAGGYAARFDGSAYEPHQTSGGLLCAPDEDSWHSLQTELLNGIQRDLRSGLGNTKSTHKV
jgi:fructose-1,6-bisphosphatase/inositol monophosphatase family enzyme